MTTLNKLIEFAIKGAAASGTFDDLADIWSFYYDTSRDVAYSNLEDLRISRLDLDGMEQDFISIGGMKL